MLCSFVDFVPVKGEIIWYLSLTAWLVSLSIMLSTSIHAVAKGITDVLFVLFCFVFVGEGNVQCNLRESPIWLMIH